ncbi:hypothetical protein D3C87_1708540 [compost metagenome]
MHNILLAFLIEGTINIWNLEKERILFFAMSNYMGEITCDRATTKSSAEGCLNHAEIIIAALYRLKVQNQMCRIFRTLPRQFFIDGSLF